MGSEALLDQVTVGMAGEESMLTRAETGMICEETVQEEKCENMAIVLIMLRKVRDNVKGGS